MSEQDKQFREWLVDGPKNKEFVYNVGDEVDVLEYSYTIDPGQDKIDPQMRIKKARILKVLGDNKYEIESLPPDEGTEIIEGEYLFPPGHLD